MLINVSSLYVSALATFAAVSQAVALPQTPVQPSCRRMTRLAGDGDPHQNYLEKQVTSNIDCNEAKTCSITKINSHTVGWSVGVSASDGEFITGGFSVSKTKTTGESKTCEFLTCLSYIITMLMSSLFSQAVARKETLYASGLRFRTLPTLSTTMLEVLTAVLRTTMIPTLCGRQTPMARSTTSAMSTAIVDRRATRNGTTKAVPAVPR